MSSTTLYRLSGISLFGGGMLIALGYMFHPSDNPAYLATADTILVHLMIFFGMFLLLLGWIGMYARQSARTGVWGLAGMLLSFFGLLMLEMPHTVAFFAFTPLLGSHLSPEQTYAFINTAFAGPVLGLMSPLSILMSLVGVITTASVTLQARVLTRGIAFALFCIPGFQVLTFIPIVSDIITALKFPAEVYLCFAAVGALIFLDKGGKAPSEGTEQGLKHSVPTASTRA